MPEISFCIFDLCFLFKLFPKNDSKFNKTLKDFESSTEAEMAKNRSKLFEDYEYSTEY